MDWGLRYTKDAVPRVVERSPGCAGRERDGRYDVYMYQWKSREIRIIGPPSWLIQLGMYPPGVLCLLTLGLQRDRPGNIMKLKRAAGVGKAPRRALYLLAIGISWLLNTAVGGAISGFLDSTAGGTTCQYAPTLARFRPTAVLK
ncbi:hypothetical protein GQ53DRAFT_226047 [Thozetella sp. PMI_491]|nr:hypothetical protein GQ53DRAFT_226047 [Thozetella sp. PMI_491]